MSNYGNVRSIKRPVRTTLGIAMKGGGAIKKIRAKTGYEVVNFTSSERGRRQELVHRLVLLSFSGECPKGNQACHGNGIRSDNRLENLRWDTVKANHRDQKMHGTKAIGARSKNAKITDFDAAVIKHSTGASRKIGINFGISKSSVLRIKNSQTWTHIK